MEFKTGPVTYREHAPCSFTMDTPHGMFPTGPIFPMNTRSDSVVLMGPLPTANRAINVGLLLLFNVGVCFSPQRVVNLLCHWTYLRPLCSTLRNKNHNASTTLWKGENTLNVEKF